MMMMLRRTPRSRLLMALVTVLVLTSLLGSAAAQTTMRPVLRGQDWVVVAGRPLAAEAGAKMFREGGNYADAGIASLLAISVEEMDSFATGGEFPALIYSASDRQVYAVNAQGTAPTGATPEFFHERGMQYPPGFGPLSSTIPAVLDGALVVLIEMGTKSFEEAVGPALRLAEEGFPLHERLVGRMGSASNIARWEEIPYSKELWIDQFPDGTPKPGDLFKNPNLAATFRRGIEAERAALRAGMSREDALQAVRDEFYRGETAAEYVRASQELGGLHTLEDFANYEAKLEEPIMVTYHGIDVYKVTTWTQGAVMLQALNILEGFDLEAMGHNSTEYVHTVIEALKLALADRDKWYGDPEFYDVPIVGLLSKEYAAERRALIDLERPETEKQVPGNPYAFEGREAPVPITWDPGLINVADYVTAATQFSLGTTSINVVDGDGNMFSLTPSGGWTPNWVAGNTGLINSQRMQSFVTDPLQNPNNVVQPGARPRITLTPSIALKDGEPFMSWSTHAGDAQDQVLLQIFLNVVHFGMNIQEAVEAPRFRTLHAQGSFGQHLFEANALDLEEGIAEEVHDELWEMGHQVRWLDRFFPFCHATAIIYRPDGIIEGASDVRGERWGIAW